MAQWVYYIINGIDLAQRSLYISYYDRFTVLFVVMNSYIHRKRMGVGARGGITIVHQGHALYACVIVTYSANN